MRQRFRVFAALSVLVTLQASAHAVAQSAPEPSKEQLQLARSLYYDGLELIDKGDWQQAADRMARVLEIRDSAVVSYHLANAFHHLQKYVDARLLLQRVLNDPSTSPEIRTAAAELLPACERAMGRLTVRLDGDLEGVQILIDGRETPSAALDVPVAVDPHEVSVVAMRDGKEVASTYVDLGGEAGLQAEAVLTVTDRVIDPAALAPSRVVAADEKPQVNLLATKSDRDADSPSVFTRWWFWTAVGAVTVGVVITSIALSSGTEPADLSSVRGDTNPGILEGTVGK